MSDDEAGDFGHISEEDELAGTESASQAGSATARRFDCVGSKSRDLSSPSQVKRLRGFERNVAVVNARSCSEWHARLVTQRRFAVAL